MARKRKTNGVIFSEGRALPDTVWEVYAQLLSDIFGEIVEDNELLVNCYCPIRTRKFDEHWITSITTGIPTALLSEPGKNPNDFLTENLKTAKVNNPFLILGNVGTGKSTYVHYYFKIALKKLNLDSKIEGIIIDLREIGEDADMKEQKLFIDRKIDEHIVKNYEDFYKPEYELLLKIFEDELRPRQFVYEALERRVGREKAKTIKVNDVLDIQKNKRFYNTARIKYIKEKYSKAIFIILDNVDHHEKEFQESIFLLSKSLMTDFQCPFILTAREYTFPAAYRHIRLSAFQPRFLHLSSPDIKELINLRMNYVLKERTVEDLLVKNGNDYVMINTPHKEPFKLPLSELRARLSVILQSLLSKEILHILQCLSDTDMRSLLKMVKVALSSGYLYPPERQERYTSVRPYDFLRAIMLGNNPYYRPKDPSTMILNLFENEEKNFDGNNLIRYRTLQCIDHLGDDVNIDDIYEFMKSIGYPKKKVQEVINKFLQLNLIESPYSEGYDAEKMVFVKLTLTGRFYLEELIKEKEYFGALKQATYMEEEDYGRVVVLTKESKRLSKREWIEADLASTEAFIEFLEKEEEKERKRVDEISINNNYIQSVINYKRLESISTVKPYISEQKRIILSSPSLDSAEI